MLGIAVVPLYLRFLGFEAYGLIGLLVTLQTLFSLLDFGLAPAINREVARGFAEGNLQPARQLLHTLSWIYALTGFVIALGSSAFAPMLAEHWLQTQRIPRETVVTSIMLMGVVVGCRWPAGLYLGVLNGAQRMTLSSVVAVVMATASSLGAAAILAWFSRRIEVFFLWQALIGAINALALRHAAWYALGRDKGLRFSSSSLKHIWRFSAGISGVTLSALLLTQIDKIVLSRFLSLADFGKYSFATLVASSLYLLTSPTFNVVYPRLSALAVVGDTRQLTEFYRWGTRLFAILIFPLAMLLSLFANDLVRLWTGDALLAESIAPAIALLSIGSALHGIMFFPYALQLAYGATRLPLTISLTLLILSAPLTAVLAWRFGILGGAMAWVAMHVIYILLGTWLTHRELLKESGWAWLRHDVGTPLLICLLVGLLGNQLVERGELSSVAKVCFAVLLFAISIVASIITAPRDTVRKLFYLIGRPPNHEG